MTYAEAIQFLYGLQMFGANLGLERAFKLAEFVGNPPAKLRFIHVAGTNGKGSTCAMLESIYRAAGLRVGLFTSPHLVSFRERIQVNRQLISEADVARLATEIQPQLNRFSEEQHPTMFEVLTVMALKYFAEQQCDLVIWETGLGGRLDATNIVTPLASVITNIAFDHTQWLGDTLAKIAAEKAGIIKPGVPVVTAETKPAALDVIESVALTKGACLTQVTMPANSPSAVPVNPLPLPGAHQQLNAALAQAVVVVLQPQIPVGTEAIRQGLATVNWPGRLQLVTLPGSRKILLDGAHNIAGAEALRDALETDFNCHQPVLIIGALGDKDWREICRLLSPLAGKVFTVPVASGRSATAGDLAEEFRCANPKAQITACESLSAALHACQAEPFVVITGSLYLIGEALETLGIGPADTGERALNDWRATRLAG